MPSKQDFWLRESIFCERRIIWRDGNAEPIIDFVEGEPIDDNLSPLRRAKDVTGLTREVRRAANDILNFDEIDPYKIFKEDSPEVVISTGNRRLIIRASAPGKEALWEGVDNTKRSKSPVSPSNADLVYLNRQGVATDTRTVKNKDLTGGPSTEKPWQEEKLKKRLQPENFETLLKLLKKEGSEKVLRTLGGIDSEKVEKLAQQAALAFVKYLGQNVFQLDANRIVFLLNHAGLEEVAELIEGHFDQLGEFDRRYSREEPSREEFDAFLIQELKSLDALIIYLELLYQRSPNLSRINWSKVPRQILVLRENINQLLNKLQKIIDKISIQSSLGERETLRKLRIRYNNLKFHNK